MEAQRELAEPWQAKRLCPDTNDLWSDAWFPESINEYKAQQAIKVCRRCPVQRECREAGKTESYGIWGGVMAKASKVERPAPIYVARTGTVRRLQALAVLGWTSKDVSADIRRYTGTRTNPMLLDAVRNGDEYASVTDEVAENVARAFKHLKGTMNSGTSAATAIGFAESRGWVGPYRWRGIDMDDEQAVPRAAL